VSIEIRNQQIPSPLALWRNARVQRVAVQAFVLAAVVIIGWFLLDNLIAELDRTGLRAMPFVEVSGSFPFIDFDEDFLSQRAGFGIGETSFGVDYTPNDSYADAYRAGLANTFRVAFLGIILATAIGLIAGVSRLSKNWLVSHLAEAYVETFRNVPLLVQLIFWYTAVALKLPTITDTVDVLGVMLISNRAVSVAWAEPQDGFRLWLLLLVGVVAIALIVRAALARWQDETGTPRYPWWGAIATIVVLGAITFFAAGGPLEFQRPALEGRTYVGGAQLSPEFVALLVGLVLYTGAFIAEVVRGSILAIPRGQEEAAAALGLKSMQRLRFVILPQALRIMIPPLTNQYLNLMKNSSLAVAVAFPDVFQVTRVTINQTGQAVPMIILVMLTYLAISLTISAVMNFAYNRELRGAR
jgi:general L-amino acid transport system permease protein